MHSEHTRSDMTDDEFRILITSRSVLSDLFLVDIVLSNTNNVAENKVIKIEDYSDHTGYDWLYFIIYNTGSLPYREKFTLPRQIFSHY